jgi:hypothetical protein
MLVLLLGGFGPLMALLPLGQRFPLVGGLGFIGLICLFKVMNRFEVRQVEIASGPPDTTASPNVPAPRGSRSLAGDSDGPGTR